MWLGGWYNEFKFYIDVKQSPLDCRCQSSTVLRTLFYFLGDNFARLTHFVHLMAGIFHAVVDCSSKKATTIKWVRIRRVRPWEIIFHEVAVAVVDVIVIKQPRGPFEQQWRMKYIKNVHHSLYITWSIQWMAEINVSGSVASGGMTCPLRKAKNPEGNPVRKEVHAREDWSARNDWMERWKRSDMRRSDS